MTPIAGVSLERYRKEFPVTAEWSYLSHCLVSPLPTRSAEAMKQCIEEQSAAGLADGNGQKWNDRSDAARHAASRLLNAKAEEIALVQNTVVGLAIVAAGVDWRPGDNVVTADCEFPANVYPWMNLESRGVSLRLVPERQGRVPLSELLGAVDARTRLLTISFVEFTNGYQNDLTAIGDFCRKRGIYFCVDAIQGLGAFPVDVRQSQIDFLAAGGHKWLLGPVGSGIFYCRSDLLDSLHLAHIGHGSMAPREEYLPYKMELRPNARRFEIGAANFAGAIGLGASLEMLLEIGQPAITRQINALTDYLIAGLRSRGCEVVSPLGERERSGIVSFRSPQFSAAELAERLNAAKVVVTHRSGVVRAAPHFYNNTDDLHHLLEALP